MITLITAPPGSGKTMLAVKMILSAVKAGRPVFANIKGLNVPGVQPAPDDWRDTPHGSLVVYDEAQEIFPSTGKPGRPDDPRLQAMEVHRHSGHDLVFVTQAPTFIHHHIRKLVGEHKHLHRGMGRKGSVVYTWENQVGDFSDFHSKAKANTESFKFSPEIWKHYQSATIHTHKFRIPSRLLWLAAAILVIVSWPIYRIASGQFMDTEASTLEDAGVLRAPPASAEAPLRGGAGGALSNPLYNWTSAGSIPAINGCAAGPNSCRCFGMDGLMLDISEGECRVIIERPMPLDLNLFRKSQGMGQGDREGGFGSVGSAAATAPAGTRSRPGDVGSPGQGHVWGNPPVTIRADWEGG